MNMPILKRYLNGNLNSYHILHSQRFTGNKVMESRIPIGDPDNCLVEIDHTDYKIVKARQTVIRQMVSHVYYLREQV